MSRANPLPVEAVVALDAMTPPRHSLADLVERVGQTRGDDREHALRVVAARALLLAGEHELFRAVVNVAQAKHEAMAAIVVAEVNHAAWMDTREGAE